MTQDQREILANLEPDQWDAVSALCTHLTKQMADRVLNSNTMMKTDRDMALEKAKYDGAVSLAGSIARAKLELKMKDDPEEGNGKRRKHMVKTSKERLPRNKSQIRR